MMQNQQHLIRNERNFHTVGFYWEQARKCEAYYKDFLNTWQLSEGDKIETGPAVEMYMGYQRAVMNQDPGKLAIAMLPCSMLYPWLVRNTKVILPTYVKDWFAKNR